LLDSPLTIIAGLYLVKQISSNGRTLEMDDALVEKAEAFMPHLPECFNASMV
jgi:hypothetical protein